MFADLNNDYCTLNIDFQDNVISGNEVIVTDDFIVHCSDRVFSHLEYYLKLQYYYIPADVDGSRTGETPIETTIRLTEGDNTITFNNYPIYLQDNCELIIKKSDKSINLPVMTLTLDVTESTISTSESVVLSATLTNNSVPVEGYTVNFYEGDTRLGDDETDANGVASITISNLTQGEHNFNADYADLLESNVKRVLVIDTTNVLELVVTGSSFTADNDEPFLYTGDNLIIDWDDGNNTIYTNGSLSHAFNDSSSSHTIKIYGNLTTLNEFAFYHCDNLKEVSLPDTVTRILDSCFSECSLLDSIEFSSNLTLLGANVFSYCTSLTSVTLPNTVITLGLNCFSGCSNLASITLSSSLKTIDYGCFKACTSLSSISIPTTVTNIGAYCFSGCVSLSTILYYWTTYAPIIPYNSTWIIGGVHPNFAFSIPSGTNTLYTSKNYPSAKLVVRG